MDIVAIMGSPRKHANTDMLLDEMIRGAEENGHNVIKHYISDLDVHHAGAAACARVERTVSSRMMGWQ